MREESEKDPTLVPGVFMGGETWGGWIICESTPLYIDSNVARLYLPMQPVLIQQGLNKPVLVGVDQSRVPNFGESLEGIVAKEAVRGDIGVVIHPETLIQFWYLRPEDEDPSLTPGRVVTFRPDIIDGRLMAADLTSGEEIRELRLRGYWNEDPSKTRRGRFSLGDVPFICDGILQFFVFHQDTEIIPMGGQPLLATVNFRRETAKNLVFDSDRIPKEPVLGQYSFLNYLHLITPLTFLGVREKDMTVRVLDKGKEELNVNQWVYYTPKLSPEGIIATEIIPVIGDKIGIIRQTPIQDTRVGKIEVDGRLYPLEASALTNDVYQNKFHYKEGMEVKLSLVKTVQGDDFVCNVSPNSSLDSLLFFGIAIDDIFGSRIYDVQDGIEYYLSGEKLPDGTLISFALKKKNSGYKPINVTQIKDSQLPEGLREDAEAQKKKLIKKYNLSDIVVDEGGYWTAVVNSQPIENGMGRSTNTTPPKTNFTAKAVVQLVPKEGGVGTVQESPEGELYVGLVDGSELPLPEGDKRFYRGGLVKCTPLDESYRVVPVQLSATRPKPRPR